MFKAPDKYKARRTYQNCSIFYIFGDDNLGAQNFKGFLHGLSSHLWSERVLERKNQNLLQT